MRFLLFFTAIISAIGLLYKWRYRVFNILLAISFLRRLAISLSMKMPGLREKVLPGIFSKPPADFPNQ